MTRILWIKRILSLGILLCFFLPLCQCSSKPQGASSTPDTKAFVFVPVEAITFKRADEWPLLLAFLWPVLAIAAEGRVRGKRARVRIVVNTLEILAATASIAGFAQVFQLYPALLLGGVLLVSLYVLHILITCAALMRMMKGPE